MISLKEIEHLETCVRNPHKLGDYDRRIALETIDKIQRHLMEEIMTRDKHGRVEIRQGGKVIACQG